MRSKIQKLIYQAVCEVSGVCIQQDKIHLEHPELEDHGDYSTNIALTLKGGVTLSQKIADKIKDNDLIEKVEIAGPGFINIWIKTDHLVNQLDRVTEVDKNENNKKTVIVEYSSPNIAKYFGIGHLRSTIIGQALYNIYKFLGYEVIGDNHLGDWGTQFGKLIYMIDSKKPAKLDLDTLEKLYVEFHTHPEWDKEGAKWFKKLEEGDEYARLIWQQCIDISQQEFERIYSLLGVQIDNAFGESFYEKMMPKVISEALSKGIAQKSEGALIIQSGLKTPLMLQKSDGGTTYATRDLATLKFRHEKWNPDIIIYEVGVEQTLHFDQVFAAARQLGYVDNKTILIHTKHGLYLGSDGKKFKTRTGNTVKLEEVLNEAIDRAKVLGNSDPKIAQAVGIGAIKYFDLLHNVQSDIIFDWDKILALEGNSGPYLQYTYARTQSLLAKASPPPAKLLPVGGDRGVVLNDEELAILRFIYRFSEVVEEAALRYAPNLLCNFLFELAQRFNTFYNKHTIKDNKFRLELTGSVGKVLKTGLNLLGIEALEKM